MALWSYTNDACMHGTNQRMLGYVREHYKHYIIECEIKPSKLTS